MPISEVPKISDVKSLHSGLRGPLVIWGHLIYPLIAGPNDSDFFVTRLGMYIDDYRGINMIDRILD